MATGTIARPGGGVDDSAPARRPRRRIPTLLLVAAAVLSVLGAFGTYALVKTYDPTFRSTGAVAFDQPQKLAASTNAGVIDKLSRLRSTYVGLAKTDAVLEPVSAEVGLPRGTVATRVFTTVDESSLLLVVGADSGTAESARRIATALANELVVATERAQTEAKVPDRDRIVASVVIEPRGAVQTAPTVRRGVTAAVVVGLLVLIGVLGVGFLIRRIN